MPAAYRAGTVPKPGQLIRLGAAASVQFDGERRLCLRVIHVDDRATYHGWLWLDGYVIDDDGNAVDRRTVFVQQAGLEPAPL